MDRNNTREEDLIQHSEEREGDQLSQGEKALTVYTGSLVLGQIRAPVNPPVLTTHSSSEISNSSIASRTKGRVRANMEPIQGRYKRNRGRVMGAKSTNTVVCRAALVSLAKSMSEHSPSDNNRLSENVLDVAKTWQIGKMLKESNEEM
ncbi:hypothetical protein Dimus_001520, partial [Dionaea muscipula]